MTEKDWIFLSHTKPEIDQSCKIKSAFMTAYGTWDGEEFIDISRYKGAMLFAPWVKWKPSE